MRNAIGAGVPCATSKVCKYQGLYYRSFTRGFACKEGTGRARRFLRASRRRVLRDPRRTATLSLVVFQFFGDHDKPFVVDSLQNGTVAVARTQSPHAGAARRSGALQTHSDLSMPNESPRGHRDPCTTP